MAIFGKREPTDGDAATQIARAAQELDESTDGNGPDTAVQRTAPLPIPPLLTEEDDGDERAAPDAGAASTDDVIAAEDAVMIAETVGAMGVAPDPDAGEDPVLPEVPGEAEAAREQQVRASPTTAAELSEEPTTVGAAVGESATRDRVIDAANVARERAAEHAGVVRERAAEHAGVAREKAAEHAAAARERAGEAKERLADGAAEAKIRGAKMRKRFAEAAADARDSASIAAAEARERVANADVNEFAHSTTRLIDTARPFFLAGFGLLFAALGFLEGDSGTAELFVGGSIIFVIGAGFSGEINAYLAAKLHRSDAPAALPEERPVAPPPSPSRDDTPVG